MLTGNPVSYVINSHYHNDHIRGNQVFPDKTVIISTAEIRELINENEPNEIEAEKEYAPKRLAALQREFVQTQDSAKKAGLTMWIGYFKGMLNSHDNLKTVLPDSLFRKELVIKGNTRKVKLMEFQYAHTRNDIILYLEEDGILFTGDLLFVDCHPYLADGNPDSLVYALKVLHNMKFKVVVPGHGPVSIASDMNEMIDYVYQLKALSKRMLSKEITMDDITVNDIPNKFSTWQFPDFFMYNLSFMLNLNDPKPVEL